jgi:hypothetical protein
MSAEDLSDAAEISMTQAQRLLNFEYRGKLNIDSVIRAAIVLKLDVSMVFTPLMNKEDAA